MIRLTEFRSPVYHRRFSDSLSFALAFGKREFALKELVLGESEPPVTLM